MARLGWGGGWRQAEREEVERAGAGVWPGVAAEPGKAGWDPPLEGWVEIQPSELCVISGASESFQAGRWPVPW